MSSQDIRVEPKRRAVAFVALASLVLALIAVVVGFDGHILRLVAVAAVLLVVVIAAWYAATRGDARRYIGAAIAVIAIGLEVLLIFGGERHGTLLVVIGVCVAVSVVSVPYALGQDVDTLEQAPTPGTRVPAARQGVLIMNLKSGGGKAEKFHLDDECRKRGIEPIVLQPGDDMLELARDAVERGADVIGMAGGDGSQALVASVVAEHDVAHVCIPSGTRNHFALDIGIDRDDVVGALDAFGEAVEKRIDLATVNGRVFVNNVSLGVYAKIVQSPEYRDAKRQTTASMLPELLGPDAEPFDLHFTGPDGEAQDGSQLIQVSNNPYVLTRLGGSFGTRERIDTGTLGVAAVHIQRDTDIAKFVALQGTGQLDRFSGWLEWATPTFEVRSDSGVEAGVDGEALVLDPPLQFASRPGALRIRIPTHAPGHSPAARASRSFAETLKALALTLAGRPT